MEAKILAILKELQTDYDFEEDVDFIERSYLDSFDVVTLVTELEREFSIIISALDIVPENFVSISAICTLVRHSKKVNRGT